MGGQLGPSVNAIRAIYAVEVDQRIQGELLVTGAESREGVPPFTAQWTWFEARDVYPGLFTLRARADRIAGAAQTIWRFKDQSFPTEVPAFSPAGYVAHKIVRPDDSIAGHMFNRRDGTLRRQVWATHPTELDADRKLRHRDTLRFTLDDAPSPGPVREVTTLAP